MAGTHAHSAHGGCTHHSAAGMSETKLKLSLLLTLSFVVIEGVTGLRAGSLALLSDAGHNFTDALALALSWYAIWIAGKPATPSKTYGYHRVGILTALFNALTLIVIALFIFSEAWQAFAHPHSVSSVPDDDRGKRRLRDEHGDRPCPARRSGPRRQYAQRVHPHGGRRALVSGRDRGGGRDPFTGWVVCRPARQRSHRPVHRVLVVGHRARNRQCTAGRHATRPGYRRHGAGDAGRAGRHRRS